MLLSVKSLIFHDCIVNGEKTLSERSKDNDGTDREAPLSMVDDPADVSLQTKYEREKRSRSTR